MRRQIGKFFRAWSEEGAANALAKTGHYLRQRSKWWRVLRHGRLEDRFTAIHSENAWTSGESRSGYGSEILQTTALRAALPGLFESRGITTVFDGPCGDFNWMRLVVEQTGIRYIGADIVGPMIAELQRRHAGREGVEFRHMDLTTDRFPEADLWISRDCWFHLSYADLGRMLRNFVASPVPLVLTSSHVVPGGHENRDIRSGDFRLIDLFSPPFSFPEAALWQTDDGDGKRLSRRMYLFSRDQVADVVKNLP